MKTLKSFVDAEAKKRKEKHDAKLKIFREMVAALSIEPQDRHDGDTAKYLGDNGIKLGAEVIEDTQTIELWYRDDHVHKAKIVCDARGYSFTAKEFGMGPSLALDEILQSITEWYLNLVENKE